MKSIARLKASLKIWVVIYPALTLSLQFLSGPLSSLPLYLRTMVLTLALVPFVVFIGVPFVDRILGSLSPAGAARN